MGLGGSAHHGCQVSLVVAIGGGGARRGGAGGSAHHGCQVSWVVATGGGGAGGSALSGELGGSHRRGWG